MRRRIGCCAIPGCFALATLAGIVPASFLLAHFGAELAAGEAEQAMVAVLGLGALVALPLVIKLARDYFNARRKS